MPRRFAPRQHLSISLNVKLGGVFWTKFEHFLSKTNNDSLRPATARFARSDKEKFCLQFFICARPIFSSKRKTKLFFVGLLLTSRVAGLRFGSGEAEFPPHPHSASPSLPTALFSADLECVFCKAKCAARADVALAPTLPCAGNDKELPKDSFTIFEKLVIIIVSRKNALYYILYTIMLNNYERYVKQ